MSDIKVRLNEPIVVAMNFLLNAVFLPLSFSNSHFERCVKCVCGMANELYNVLFQVVPVLPPSISYRCFIGMARCLVDVG